MQSTSWQKTRIRAGYYDFKNFSLIKDETNGWWNVYEWNADHTESTFVCSGHKLWYAEVQLRQIIKLREGV